MTTLPCMGRTRCHRTRHRIPPGPTFKGPLRLRHKDANADSHVPSERGRVLRLKKSSKKNVGSSYRELLEYELPEYELRTFAALAPGGMACRDTTRPPRRINEAHTRSQRDMKASTHGVQRNATQRNTTPPDFDRPNNSTDTAAAAGHRQADSTGTARHISTTYTRTTDSSGVRGRGGRNQTSRNTRNHGKNYENTKTMFSQSKIKISQKAHTHTHTPSKEKYY